MIAVHLSNHRVMYLIGLYGWTNGHGSEQASSGTNCLLEALFAELEQLGQPPFLMVGDFNANTDDLFAFDVALQSGRIIDVGQCADRFGQPPSAPTCYATPTSQGTRRDYVFSSPELFSCFTGFEVTRDIATPVHAISSFTLEIPFEDPTKRVLRMYPSLATSFYNHFMSSTKCLLAKT